VNARGRRCSTSLARNGCADAVRGALLSLVLTLLMGCAAAGQPDLARLYASSQSNPYQPPVILIPGIMGSRLADADNREVWVGSPADLVFSSYAELALTLPGEEAGASAPRLHPTRLTDTFAGQDFYASIVRVFEQAGGYRRARPGTPVAPGQRSYYEFSYDWRQDNVTSARQLGALIEQIRADHQDPALQVDIVAHSMGGLIARYYLSYGGQDVLNGEAFVPNYAGEHRVRRVALLGTPNVGSVSSLHAFISGRKIGLGTMRTETLATFPSVYQLFPHPLNNWIIAEDGSALDVDLFSPDTWRRFRWSIFDPQTKRRIIADHPQQGDHYYAALEKEFAQQLERARRFVWSLTVTLERNPWELRVFGGDCALTPARILVEEVGGASRIRLWPHELAQPRRGIDYDRLMLEPGDGSVTKASLLARDSLNPAIPRPGYSYFAVSGEMFVCEQHDRLSTNISFQDNLLQYLLTTDL
jgi:pimeloyl-ACP methyl ester carboxylesterase